VRRKRRRAGGSSGGSRRGKFMYPGMRPRAVKCNFANPNSASGSQIRGLMYRKYQTNELSRRFKRVVTVVAGERELAPCVNAGVAAICGPPFFFPSKGGSHARVSSTPAIPRDDPDSVNVDESVSPSEEAEEAGQSFVINQARARFTFTSRTLLNRC